MVMQLLPMMMMMIKTLPHKAFNHLACLQYQGTDILQWVVQDKQFD